MLQWAQIQGSRQKKDYVTGNEINNETQAVNNESTTKTQAKHNEKSSGNGVQERNTAKRSKQ